MKLKEFAATLGLAAILVLLIPICSHAETTSTTADDDDILDMILPIIISKHQQIAPNSDNKTLEQLGVANGISTSEIDHILVSHYTDLFTAPKTRRGPCTHTYQVTAAVKACDRWNWSGKCTHVYVVTKATYACDTWATEKKVMNCDWYLDAPVSSSMRFQVDKAQTAYNTFIASLVTKVKEEIKSAINTALLDGAVAAAVAALPSAGTASPATFEAVFGYAINAEMVKKVLAIREWILINTPVLESAVEFTGSAFPVLTKDNLHQSCGWSPWQKI